MRKLLHWSKNTAQTDDYQMMEVKMSVFVIPMVGLSSRFFKAGYDKPKYQLDIHGVSMFEWSVRSFYHYFSDDLFLFIVRDVYQSPADIDAEVAKMGIRHYQVVVLDEMTAGQADTVYQGLKAVNIDYDEPIFIFNIDSALHQFRKPEWLGQCDGYLEVFEGEGNHWSFAQVNEQNNVIKTAEKQRISSFCSNGLYYFRSVALFQEAYEDANRNNKLSNGELYVAPLYNYLIEKNLVIKIELVDIADISFCGTPDEYESFLENKNV